MKDNYPKFLLTLFLALFFVSSGMAQKNDILWSVNKDQIKKDDINAVVKVLKSNFLTTGPKVPIFEREIQKLTKSKFVFACNSGSSALHLACLALNLKKNDIVWTTPNTYAASAK